jgi:hypothetical protein
MWIRRGPARDEVRFLKRPEIGAHRLARGLSDSLTRKQEASAAKAEEEVRADQSRSNRSIAEASGMNPNSVSKLRRELGLPSPHEATAGASA